MTFSSPAPGQGPALAMPVLGAATPAPLARSNGSDMGLDAQVFNRLLK